jgi:hypothetical protein
VLPEHAVVFDSNNVVRVLGIVLFQMQQNLEFYTCLMLELLLVPDDLDCDDFARLVIDAFEGLSK